MWCEITKQGKAKYCERYTDPLTGESKKISVTLEKKSAKNEKLAEKELQRRIADKICQSSVSIDKLTFSELIDKYIEYKKSNYKASTYRRDKYCFKSIESILGSKTLVSVLSARYIRESMTASKKDNGTLNEYLTRLKAMLRWAYRNDYISDISYLDKLERFKDTPHRVKIQDKYLESEEIDDVINSMKKSGEWFWIYLTKFLILSGLRIGEATALLESDIDDEYIHITKTYDANNKVVSAPKTLESLRDVFIQDELKTLIKQIRAWKKANRIVSTQLFLSEDGDFLHYDAYRMFIERHALKVTGKHITPHALRHTHASLLLENGVSVDSITRRLGHKDSKITKEIYLHVTQKLKERDNAAIKDIKIM